MRSHSRAAASDMRQKNPSFLVRQAAQFSAANPCIVLGLRTAGAGVRKLIVWGRSAIIALGMLEFLSSRLLEYFCVNEQGKGI